MTIQMACPVCSSGRHYLKIISTAKLLLYFKTYTVLRKNIYFRVVILLLQRLKLTYFLTESARRRGLWREEIFQKMLILEFEVIVQHHVTLHYFTLFRA